MPRASSATPAANNRLGRLQRTAPAFATALFLVASSSLATEEKALDVVRFEVSPVVSHDIEAQAVDQTFRVQVKVPPHRPRSKRQFGVLYVTDVNASLGALADEVHLMGMAGEIPLLIVVGIGYPVDSTAQALRVRTRDLTPVADPALAELGVFAPWLKGTLKPSRHTEGGGARDFLGFLHQELFPFIEANYPAKSDDRAYFGDSLGGLFGLWVLLERPQTFSRYILGSPSTWVADEWIMRRAAAVVRQVDDLPAKVFLGIGGEEEDGDLARFEMVTNLEELHAQLEGADLPSLEVTRHVFPGESHHSVVLMSLMRGLRAVYEPQSNALLDAMIKELGSRRPPR